MVFSLVGELLMKEKPTSPNNNILSSTAKYSADGFRGQCF